jgi:NADPH-dependent curcumin reductase CurA
MPTKDNFAIARTQLAPPRDEQVLVCNLFRKNIDGVNTP